MTNRCCLTRDQEALYQDTNPHSELVPAAPAPTPTAAAADEQQGGASAVAHTAAWKQATALGSRGSNDGTDRKRSKWEKCAGLRARVALQMLGMLDKLMSKPEVGDELLAAAGGGGEVEGGIGSVEGGEGGIQRVMADILAHSDSLEAPV